MPEDAPKHINGDLRNLGPMMNDAADKMKEYLVESGCQGINFAMDFGDNHDPEIEYTIALSVSYEDLSLSGEESGL